MVSSFYPLYLQVDGSTGRLVDAMTVLKIVESTQRAHRFNGLQFLPTLDSQINAYQKQNLIKVTKKKNHILKYLIFQQYYHMSHSYEIQIMWQFDKFRLRRSDAASY